MASPQRRFRCGTYRAGTRPARRSAPEPRLAADAEALLEGNVLLAVLLRRPDEERTEEDGDDDHEDAHHDLGGEIHQASTRGKLRWRRGGTRKFCRCVVRSTELNPWFRSRGSSGSFDPGSTPSIARRFRWKSSLVGLNTMKWIPACGLSRTTSCSLDHSNGLSSVLKSARTGIAVPFG